jgi:predicted transcriptional regulator
MAIAWLKEILGEHYSEDIDKKVSDEIGKGFVAKADFNAANEAKKQLEVQIKGHAKEIESRDKQLEELKKVDATGLQAKITELEEANKTAEKTRKKEFEEAQKAHELEIVKLKRQAETKEFMGGHKFVNDLTRDALMAKLEEALDKPENAGKSRKELLDGLTAGEDGKPRADIFAPQENPNKLGDGLPPAGTAPEGAAKFVPPPLI